MISSKTYAQQLWAKYKYAVLSQSQNQYRAIRTYLKNDSIDIETLKNMIVIAQQIPENRGEVINCAMHIWGYFKRVATENEKSEYIAILENYKNGNISKAALLLFFKRLLQQYPNRYLENSSIFTGEILKQ